MLLLLSVVGTAVGIFILGTLVWLRGVRSPMHISFGIFAYNMSFWMLVNFLDTNYKASPLAPLATYLDFFSGAILAYVIWVFVTTLLTQADTRAKYHRLYGMHMRVFLGALTALAALSAFSPGVLQITQPAGHDLNIAYGPGYTLYSGLLLAVVLMIIVNVFLAQRLARGRLREQISIILAALVVAVLMLGFADLLLPDLSTAPVINLISGDLSYLGIALLVAGTFYSIVRRHLFDLRLAIARSIGFIVIIGIVAVGYSLITLLISAPIFSNGGTSVNAALPQLLIFLPPTVIVALTVPALEQLIASATNKIFFQHAYDSRAVLDSFSDALISDNELALILSRGMQVMHDALRPTAMSLIVLDKHKHIYKQHTIGQSLLAEPDDVILAALGIDQRIVMKDEVQVGKWNKHFEANDIALVLKLGSDNSVTGLLFLGPKQNGRIYTKQDTELLTVSAKNFGIAIENAKKYEQIAAFADTMHAEVLNATASLRKANTKLKTLDALKDDFISMASHQLRSPAASVHEAIKMLEQSYLKPAERKKIIELVDASSERLLNVVTDMLSVARIQAGHFTIEKTNLDLVELVDRALMQASALATEKNITLKFEHPKVPIELRADRAKLNEMISNYVENAIRYSNEGTRVMVSVRQEARRMYCEVEDQGMGVPQESRKSLFSKFYRAANARREQPNGNGIGLFVVKTIAEAHGGDVYYRPLATGSLFGFWLPVAK